MVGERYLMQVRDGQLEEFWEICRKLNEVNRARGRREFSFWASAGGVSNEVVAEVDSPDHASGQQQFDAFHADPEALGLDEKLHECLVEGSMRSELLEEVPV